MEPGALKPLLTALVMPPVAPMLLALLGLVISARHWLGGVLTSLAGLALLWFLSCNAIAVHLAQALLPQVQPVSVQRLSTDTTQAIVVLGGGVLADSPEYGQAQPASATLRRLRYGAWLARQTRKPLAFAGGVGWGAAGTGAPTEGSVAERTARQEWDLPLRWIDDRSRDTAEGATEMWRLMQRDRVSRIVLVTDAWHMPRSVLWFRRAGFEVTPAPTGFITSRSQAVLEWLPSSDGLSASREVLREWLGLRLAGS